LFEVKTSINFIKHYQTSVLIRFMQAIFAPDFNQGVEGVKFA